MFSALSRWRDRRADDALRRDNERLSTALAELQHEHDKAKRTIRVQEVELQALSAVVARNIKRVEAETAAAARHIVDAEKGQPQWRATI